MINRNIQILDSTLREGEQTPGVSFSRPQKIDIVNMLSGFGVDFIELGHPAVSGSIYEDISVINKLKIKPEKIVHSRLMKEDIDDAIELKVSWVGLFFDISENNIQSKYGLSLEKSLSLIEDCIKYAKKNGLKVRFTAEDASRVSIDHLIEIAKIVEIAGADRFSFADTVGILYPQKVLKIIELLVDTLKIPVHGHFHNDLGLATANALQAIQSGASCIDVTINGIGERCGISSLAEIVACLDEIFKLKNNWNFKMLKDMSSYIDKITRIKDKNIRPITGENVFSHNGGLHVSSVIKDNTLYEPIDLKKYNGTRKIVIDKFSGKDALDYRLKNLGFHLDQKRILELLKIIKAKPEVNEWSDNDLYCMLERSKISISK